MQGLLRHDYLALFDTTFNTTHVQDETDSMPHRCSLLVGTFHF